MTRKKKIIRCSHCGETHAEVYKMVAGPKGWICDDCLRAGLDVLGSMDIAIYILTAGRAAETEDKEVAAAVWQAIYDLPMHVVDYNCLTLLRTAFILCRGKMGAVEPGPRVLEALGVRRFGRGGLWRGMWLAAPLGMNG